MKVHAIHYKIGKNKVLLKKNFYLENFPVKYMFLIKIKNFVGFVLKCLIQIYFLM